MPKPSCTGLTPTAWWSVCSAMILPQQPDCWVRVWPKNSMPNNWQPFGKDCNYRTAHSSNQVPIAFLRTSIAPTITGNGYSKKIRCSWSSALVPTNALLLCKCWPTEPPPLICPRLTTFLRSTASSAYPSGTTPLYCQPRSPCQPIANAVHW